MTPGATVEGPSTESGSSPHHELRELIADALDQLHVIHCRLVALELVVDGLLGREAGPFD